MTDEPQGGLPDMPSDQGGADPASNQVNMEMAQRVMALFGKIDQVMDELDIASRDRQQVMQNLMEAIAADLMTRLGKRMSEDETQELTDMAQSMDMKNPDLQSVASFFRGRFTQEELMEELAGATEGVLEDFVNEMSK